MARGTNPRHGLLALAGAVSIACAACAQQTASPPAAAAAPVATEADTAPAPSPDAHRFTIGALQATALRDGDMTLPNDGSIIAMGESKDEVDALLEAAGEPTDTLRLAIQGLLVEAGNRVILFDTGAGTADPAYGGRLPQSLRAAGVEPSQVTDVFISHLHQDHVGGLVDGDGQPSFANATVRMSAPEWEALRADSGQAALAKAIASQVETFEPGAPDVVPGVSAVAVDGHTPGHSAYLVGGDRTRLLYIGDSAHHHVISVQRPRWTILFDGDAPLAEDSREALLARAADEALLVHSPHFPFPGLGRIERRDEGYAWVPVP